MTIKNFFETYPIQSNFKTFKVRTSEGIFLCEDNIFYCQGKEMSLSAFKFHFGKEPIRFHGFPCYGFRDVFFTLPKEFSMGTSIVLMHVNLIFDDFSVVRESSWRNYTLSIPKECFLDYFPNLDILEVIR